MDLEVTQFRGNPMSRKQPQQPVTPDAQAPSKKNAFKTRLLNNQLVRNKRIRHPRQAAKAVGS